uniref:Sulfotransferase n=1 Tax=Neogobius melanostomus TaxID=47308 RepID=A0A8C6S8N4_9GOBI
MSTTPIPELITHKGFRMIKGIHFPHEVDQIRDLELRDSDVFVATFPKSGTIWMQQILLLLKCKGNKDSICKKDTLNNGDLVPWIEGPEKVQDFVKAEHPRYYVTHLPYHLIPQELSRRRGKVIYVARNPKDVLVSYYHFHKSLLVLETPKSFDEFFDKFMRGDVMAGSWFEHIKTWFSHKDDINMLFLTYEEMIQDLQIVVKKIAEFLGADLTQDQLNSVVKHSTFRNMRQDPHANYEKTDGVLINQQAGCFLRKGTIGDWKNHFTVAQSERFNEVFKQEMKDFPVSFIWDIKDIS